MLRRQTPHPTLTPLLLLVVQRRGDTPSLRHLPSVVVVVLPPPLLFLPPLLFAGRVREVRLRLCGCGCFRATFHLRMAPLLFLLFLEIGLLLRWAVGTLLWDCGTEVAGRLGAFVARIVKPVGPSRKVGLWMLQYGEKRLFLRALLFEGCT